MIAIARRGVTEFLVDYWVDNRPLLGNSCRCSSIHAVKAAVTRLRRKYGDPNTFECEEDLWNKLNISLLGTH